MEGIYLKKKTLNGKLFCIFNLLKQNSKYINSIFCNEAIPILELN